MKEEKKKLIISLFIVFIMVSSGIGYMFGKDGGEKYKYNDHSFLKRGNEWVLKVDGGELVFSYFPETVENIDLNFDISALNGLVEIDTTSDPDDKFKGKIAEAQYKMQDVLGKASNTYILNGMTDENDFNMPIIGCDKATSLVPVIYFKESNETKIEKVGECIIAEARSELDVLALKDRILYGMLGIIEQ
ncbi:MAG: hypothetical protein V3V78_01120 [Candidatus Woesearchaeota archaeon]